MHGPNAKVAALAEDLIALAHAASAAVEQQIQADQPNPPTQALAAIVGLALEAATVSAELSAAAQAQEAE